MPNRPVREPTTPCLLSRGSSDTHQAWLAGPGASERDAARLTLPSTPPPLTPATYSRFPLPSNWRCPCCFSRVVAPCYPRISNSPRVTSRRRNRLHPTPPQPTPAAVAASPSLNLSSINQTERRAASTKRAGKRNFSAKQSDTDTNAAKQSNAKYGTVPGRLFPLARARERGPGGEGYSRGRSRPRVATMLR